jgi:hypothetical protein
MMRLKAVVFTTMPGRALKNLQTIRKDTLPPFPAGQDVFDQFNFLPKPGSSLSHSIFSQP